MYLDKRQTEQFLKYGTVSMIFYLQSKDGTKSRLFVTVQKDDDHKCRVFGMRLYVPSLNIGKCLTIISAYSTGFWQGFTLRIDRDILDEMEG